MIAELSISHEIDKQTVAEGRRRLGRGKDSRRVGSPPTEVGMTRFSATIWSWTLLSMAEKASVLLAILMVLGVAALAVYGGYNVGAHIGQPGWSCGETIKGGLSCRPDPKSAMGRFWPRG